MNEYDPNFVPKKTFALLGQKAIILNKQNKILVLQRSEKSGNGGKWSLPGGAIDFGEEPLASIKREIAEESQLDNTDHRVYAFRSYMNRDNEHIIMIGWICKSESDNPILNWEHDNYKWLTKEDALKLDLTEDGRYFLEQFEL